MTSSKIKDFTQLTIDESKKKNSISYSQYSMYEQCNHRWKLNYVDKHRVFTDSIHTLFGTAMHEVIQVYLHVLYNKSVSEADSLDLDLLLRDRMQAIMSNLMEDEKFEHFTDQKEMKEFYYDGLDIIDWVKNHRREYFSNRGFELVGIETPINYEIKNGIYMKGYIDLVIRDTIHNMYKIIDLKTSTRGWNKYQKSDPMKTSQLIIYKEYYAKQYNVPVDNIDVEFIILKRKLFESSAFPQKRIQKITPASGNVTRKRVRTSIEKFIDNAFDDDGQYVVKDYETNPSKKSCRWCEFKNNKELCKDGVK